MKCDSCGREMTDEQLSIHDSSGIRFCKDREDCHQYRKHGRFALVADQIVNAIIVGKLLHAECSENKDHGCIVVWSSQAQEQIAALICDKLK
jgi:hypothetical protein